MKSDDAWLKWHTPQTVWLVISSWRGKSIGAIHYYGRLKLSTYSIETQSIELRRILTSSEARDLTKLQNDNSLFGLKFTWKKGDQTTSFDSEEDVKELAKSTYQKHFPKATRLVLGDPLYCKPERVLEGVEP